MKTPMTRRRSDLKRRLLQTLVPDAVKRAVRARAREEGISVAALLRKIIVAAVEGGT